MFCFGFLIFVGFFFGIPVTFVFFGTAGFFLTKQIKNGNKIYFLLKSSEAPFKIFFQVFGFQQ
jgi:hypothetical protein